MHKRPVWPLILMIVWFSAIGLLSLVAAFFGMAFSTEPGGRGNPGVIEYAMIFGPLIATILLGTATIVLWRKGKSAVALACWALSLVVSLALLSLLGL